MRKLYVLLAAAAICGGLFATIAYAAFSGAAPFKYDPAATHLVADAHWLDGIGCPTNARQAAYPSTKPTSPPGPLYSDSACPPGAADPMDSHANGDNHNQGLLLVKSGPTNNNASDGANLNGVNGITLTELGYDIRHGSHCGAGAPRFDVQTSTGFFFVGCSSPAPDSTVLGDQFDRLRWGNGAPGSVTGFSSTCATPSGSCGVTGTVQSISVVFDEGSTDGNGFAVLDNIDVNGTLVGHG
jgi:hypothetical protein